MCFKVSRKWDQIANHKKSYLLPKASMLRQPSQQQQLLSFHCRQICKVGISTALIDGYTNQTAQVLDCLQTPSLLPSVSECSTKRSNRLCWDRHAVPMIQSVKQDVSG
eukprot:6176518-Pleurochrysis_carterae.AAC.1